MIPQIIIIALLAANITVAAAKNGQPQPNYNVISSVIGNTITFCLLYWAGTFDCFFK